MRCRGRQRNELAFSTLSDRQFAGGIEHGISHRTDMRVNSPEVAEHVEMKRGSLDGLGPAFAEAVQMPFGGGKLGVTQERFLREEFARLIDIARHKDTK